MNFKKSILIFSLLTSSIILGEGFVAGTLVKTPSSYVPVEQLKQNDSVIGYNFKNASLVIDKIVDIKKEKVNKVIQITFNEGMLEVALDHKFYCPLSEKHWVEAQDLKVDHFILKNLTELVRIDQITEVKKEVSVYTLSVSENHNFFVSDQDIFVHNFIIVAWLVGEGFVWAGAGETLAFTVAALAGWVAHKNGIDTRSFFPFQIQRPDDNKWKDHILGNDYHGFNGKDPKKIWNLTELAIVAAMKRDELKNGCKFTTQLLTKYGTLEVVGKVVNNVVKIGTAYIKGYKV